MIDLIVFSSVGFLAIFFIAWMRYPGLRAWIERPKHRFQANVQSYDQQQKLETFGTTDLRLRRRTTAGDERTRR